MNLDERLQAHFLLREFLKSDKAVELGIDMTNPPQEIIENIRNHAAPTAERVRGMVNVKVRVVNCWRPLALNRAIGSRDTSAHVEALALDLQAEGMTPEELFDVLRKDPDFMEGVDQLIIERGCVHVGLPCHATAYQPRHELRTEKFVDGKPTYPIWKDEE